MPTIRTRSRRISTLDNGLSLYVVETLNPPPTFTQGDGYDGARNLLGAVLIGPVYRTVGYVVGARGAWSAYTSQQWHDHGARPGLPLCQLAPCATVADAVEALSATLIRLAEARQLAVRVTERERELGRKGGR